MNRVKFYGKVIRISDYKERKENKIKEKKVDLSVSWEKNIEKNLKNWQRMRKQRLFSNNKVLKNYRIK